MSDEPAFSIGKLGSTFRLTEREGWRVTSPGGLALPPWDLCGFARDHDPFSLTADEWFRVQWPWWGRAQRRWLCEFYPDGTMASQVVVDPNKRDGEWPELAFMPHTPVAVAEDIVGGGDARWTVPVYMAVCEALLAEWMIRYERAERALVGRIEREQERWARLWRLVFEHVDLG